MASTTANVFAAMPASTGALRYAPLGSTLPETATEALDVAFVDLGYIGEDGFTQAEARDTEKKKAFGGSTVKVLQTDYTATVQFAFLESTNADVLKAIYGEENVTVVGDEVQVKKNKKQSPRASWVIDVIDGEGSIRTVVPIGQITEVDDITKVHTDTIMYTVTVECFEDENGDNILEYINPGLGS